MRTSIKIKVSQLAQHFQELAMRYLHLFKFLIVVKIINAYHINTYQRYHYCLTYLLDLFQVLLLRH